MAKMRATRWRSGLEPASWYPPNVNAESMFEEMKRYVRFDETDACLLLRFRPAAEPQNVPMTPAEARPCWISRVGRRAMAGRVGVAASSRRTRRRP